MINIPEHSPYFKCKAGGEGVRKVGYHSALISLCSSSSESDGDLAMLTFPEVTVTPHPIVVPGDVEVSIRMRVRQEVASDLTLDLRIERFVGFFWLTIPCIDNVGSCSYPNVCEELSSANTNRENVTTCPQQLNASGVPCTCPVQPGDYVINKAVFQVPEMTGIWSLIAMGDYRVTGRLIETSTGRELACQNMELSSDLGSHPFASFSSIFFSDSRAENMLWASFVAVVALLSQPTGGTMPFSVKDCSSSAPLLTTSDIRVIPYPVQVPGFVTASGRMVLNRPVGGDLTLEVKMKKHVKWNIWTPVPCLGNIGSWDFDDVCGRLSSISPVNCPPQLIKDNFPCTCPFTPGTYVIRNAIFHIPHSGGFWSWMKKGDYRLTARLTTSKGRELACQRVEMTIAGWL
ncbi:hypothetical protein C0Q70_11726 [Pomacea canaliculata]|uniref:MD-2-related lipid-recognition domain-containing protein n=1 Tax=Pomacea canaliculata TaxID=400727 RepID=A0A2T7P6U5_POMCA|nr:hypothetical protein C0Q70_11726 [Pomacea canaliculata]